MARRSRKPRLPREVIVARARALEAVLRRGDEGDDDEYGEWGPDDGDDDDSGAWEAEARAPEVLTEGQPVRFDLRAQAGPLARAWIRQVADCGAGSARLGRGRLYLLGGNVLEVRVGARRIQARVLGTRHYRVQVEFWPISETFMTALRQRIDGAMAARSPTTSPREVLRAVLLVYAPMILPTPTHMTSRCSCPEGDRCKHVVAAAHAFGLALDDEPELIFTLWGVESPTVAPGQGLVIAPLAADRVAVTADLGALFGIDLVGRPANSRPTIAEAAGAVPAEVTARSTSTTTPPPPPRRVPPCEQPEASREYLRVLGLTNRTIDAWIREGVLPRTLRRDVFKRTPEANRRIAEFLAR